MTTVRLDRVSRHFAPARREAWWSSLFKAGAETGAMGDPVSALRDVSLDVRAGELLVVVGPSGSGKTTLLRLLAGLDAPSQGEIWFGERNVTQVDARQRGVALVAESAALMPHLTVRDNLAWSRDQRASATPVVTGRTEESGSQRSEDEFNKWSTRLGLTELLDRYPHALSAGQQQRVALGRALLTKPRLLVLDEPLGRLDGALRLEVARSLRDAQRESGQTWIYVTHDRQEALLLGDRIAVLDGGQLLQCGPPTQILDAPRHLRVATWGWEFGGARLTCWSGTDGGNEAGSGQHDAAANRPLVACWRPDDVRVVKEKSARDSLQQEAGAKAEANQSWFEGRLAGTAPRGEGRVWAWVAVRRTRTNKESMESITESRILYGDTEETLVGDGFKGSNWVVGDRVWVGVNWEQAHWFDALNGSKLPDTREGPRGAETRAG